MNAESNEGRTVIEFPSGNLLVVDYYGGGDADRVMLYSVDCGNGSSPANLHLVIPDPDRVHYDADNDCLVSSSHHLRLRHKGPDDANIIALPEGFSNGEKHTAG